VDERRVELGRERLQWTCWPKVPAWHWPRTLASTAASVHRLRCTLWARKVT
jgi:hypothetical protein